MRESIYGRYATKSERNRLEREKMPSPWVIFTVAFSLMFVANYGDNFIMWAFPQTIEFFRPYKKQIDDLKERIAALEKEFQK